MKQSYHSNSKTNIHIRREIQTSNLSNSELASKFSISTKTVSKWKNRTELTDRSSRPKTIKYALSELNTLIAIEIRRATWWSLEEVTEIIDPVDPTRIKSAVYRTFVREGINTVPKAEKEKAKKFKEYDPGYLHVDVTYLPKIDGIKYYLFVAIDRATRTLFFKIYEAKSAENAEKFIKACIAFFPVKISHTLTDNGLEFTNRLLKSKKGETCKKKSKFTMVCEQNNIDHRCTKPFTPKTNGMVEKANDIIKSKTIKRTKYLNIKEMDEDLTNFLIHYNLYRRHGSLRRELKVKTPFDAIQKWYELDSNIFKEKPEDFKVKILNLKQDFKTRHKEQPCET